MIHTEVSSHLLQLINQIFDMEQKLSEIEPPSRLMRNVSRMKSTFEEMGFTWHNPLGESYDETRSDCDASISGSQTENLFITEVIKPIIRMQQEGYAQIVQRGIVIVSAPKN